MITNRKTVSYVRPLHLEHKYKVHGPDKLTAGKHTVKVDFAYGDEGKGGTATVSVDDKELPKAASNKPSPSASLPMKKTSTLARSTRSSLI